jgi:hypothetical protein
MQCGAVEIQLPSLTLSNKGEEQSPSCAVHFACGKISETTGYEAAWPTEPVWTQW